MPRNVARLAVVSVHSARRCKAMRNASKPSVVAAANSPREGMAHCCGLRHLGSDESMILESGWFHKLIGGFSSALRKQSPSLDCD